MHGVYTFAAHAISEYLRKPGLSTGGVHMTESPYTLKLICSLLDMPGLFNTEEVSMPESAVHASHEP